MNHTIWKFPLAVTDEQEIACPKGSIPLCVQVSEVDGRVYLWMEVDPSRESEPHTIYTRGTGHQHTGREGPYIGTYQLHNGALVFHVYDREQEGTWGL